MPAPVFDFMYANTILSMKLNGTHMGGDCTSEGEEAAVAAGNVLPLGPTGWKPYWGGCLHDWENYTETAIEDGNEEHSPQKGI